MYEKSFIATQTEYIKDTEMKKIVLTLTLTIALLFSSIAISTQIGFASTQTIVTISADGTINPTFAPIQRDGEVYTLTDDVGALVIGRSGIVFNGNGHTVTGTFEEKKVYLAYVKNVTLKNLVIEGSAYGILLDQTSNITVTNNIVKDTSVPFPASQGTAGIYIYGGANNTIVGNLLENNVKGIVLVNIFERNIISENNIKSNYMGMVFWNASNNSIYHNNFINNSVQVFDSDSTSIQANMTSSLNSWDIGYPYGGNYWSDYQTKYSNAGELDNSGVGNTSYVIDSQNKDRYPLMEPFNSTYYLLKITPPKISFLSPLNMVYNESSVPLVFNIDKAVNWTSYSLDGQSNITFSGNTNLTDISNGLHTITVYSQDTFGNIGSSETISFTVAKPESESFPVVPVAVASVVAVAFLVAGLLVYHKKHKQNSVKKP